ncbi:AMP-binding enzyme domain-containing protein [Sarocladium implicatum]|nr:AMP-binding enzyme domain-containing protein [Sarocladium implicatum]
MAQQKQVVQEPVAVIGSACRFPGACSSPSQLWELLKQPRDVLKEFDPEHLNLKRVYHENGETHGATDVKNKAYLLQEDSRVFDAAFFGISPVEAAGMDPQQRLLLETVFEAMEQAGVTLEQMRGSKTSVHVGVMTNDWSAIQLRDPETLPQYTATGTAGSIMSNRVSYIFDLKGPSVTIDTACSSSLVALHHGARGLLDGDSDVAIVAGVNLIFDPLPFVTESKLHMLSPDSQSRMWDKTANGYARGEGAAALLLKPLSKALRDGDHIEGIVRSTGVNSDGQSPGITMPFAPTQTQLIRDTYRRAGLDPIKDRPQYFECHGTGTPAGDPVEARAVSETFVTDQGKTGSVTEANPLYVGSIKTVIGHLEGCAGLAGVIKALLAIKNRVIPPNLLFDELNPAIAKYYGPLRIPTAPVPWPELPVGTPARASVNSFGFGGTNAHAIIESFEPEMTTEEKAGVASSEKAALSGPLLFSAASGSSLLRSVTEFVEYLKKNPEADLDAISWVLQTRRTTHRVRAHFSATTRAAIIESMEAWITASEKLAPAEIGYQPKLVNPREIPGVLGVFTGQGAQWPEMGRELLKTSPLFRKTLQSCEDVLTALPASDVPSWSLIEQLTLPAASSQLSKAELSQPLCTAVQLGLVELLKVSGVQFDAVVGHSSGEIAATYAAGIITLEAAMQISYYRGFHAKLAKGPQGQKGGMLAAGLSLQKAKEFCAQPKFHGCLQVAASNAPQSVTLSGDIDAVLEAKKVLDEQGMFSRTLKVDTAYHSHHMLPCAEPYLASLLACNIKISQPRQGKDPWWSSSVRGDTQILRNLDDLKGPYWVANMVQSVLFSQAVESSIWHGGPFDLAVEVGPHPALKGPTEQTLKAAYGSVPLYTGVLKRNGNDVEAFSGTLATAWAQLGPSYVDFTGYRTAFAEHSESTEQNKPNVIKGLPSYSWDHDKVYWRESRISRRYRLGDDTGHELLGRRMSDDNQREMRWRNVLKLSEMPWIRGHEVLDEVLLPGAAYVAIAVEAGKRIAMAQGKTARLLDVENVGIYRPLVVPDNRDGVETLFTAHVLDSPSEAGVIRARFAYYVCPDTVATNGSMINTCEGELTVHHDMGETAAHEDALPPRVAANIPGDLVEVDSDLAYSMFESIGLKYTGAFRAISESARCLDFSSATARWEQGSLSSDYVVHPAMLDVAFQTLFLARAHPVSGQITNALLPSHIERVRIDPTVDILKAAARSDGGDIHTRFETWATKQTPTSLTGDINIYDAETDRTFLQVEGLGTNMVGGQDASQDRPIFAKTVWAKDIICGLTAPERDPERDTQLLNLTEALERSALFYTRKLVADIGNEDRTPFHWHYQRMLEAFEGHLDLVKASEHPVLQNSWLADEWDMLDRADAAHPDSIELKFIHAVGNNMANVIRGKANLLEIVNKDDLLNRFYMEDSGCIEINGFVARAAKEIAFKFPHCNMLEIGAGTGGTTWSVLNELDDAFDSYTYTDISSGFFPNAAVKFADFAHKMVFKTLDVEKDPTIQDFVEHSYDVIIAANVLHATHNLQATLRNARKLLRPGGYLLLFETTGINTLRVPFCFGGFEGWWLGEEPGRRLRPIVSGEDWDGILQESGFSGADSIFHDVADEASHACPDQKPIVLIGGKKLSTSKTIAQIRKLLPSSWKSMVQTVPSIDALDDAALEPGSDVLCLSDADEPLLAGPMSDARMAKLQGLLMSARSLLWVTSAGNGRGHIPRASMFHGIARVMPTEVPQLQLQVLGLELNGPEPVSPTSACRHCVEAFLRLRQLAVLRDDEDVGSDDEDEGGAAQRESVASSLWAQEPEIEILSDGDVYIPRVMPDHGLNEVYLASKRTVTKTVDASELTIQAVSAPGKMILQNASSFDVTGQDESSVRVNVKLALHLPSAAEPLYLVCGQTDSSTVLTVANSNSSMLRVPSKDLVPINDNQCSSAQDLAGISKALLVNAISEIARAQLEAKAVLLYEANEALADAIDAALSAVGVKVYFASSSMVSSPKREVISFHPRSSKRVIERVVPREVGAFIDCSNASSSAVAILKECLPSTCLALQLDAGLVNRALSSVQLSTILTKSATHSVQYPSEVTGVEVVKAAALTSLDSSSLVSKTYIVDWSERESLLLTVPPLELEGLFRPDKTYFMVGAAGGLGLSICQWMIRNGARYMVIASRNPQISPSVMDDARRVGATIRAVSMDVSNRASVERAVKETLETMPPLAGLCNAAMVLSDKLFLDMDATQLNGTLAGKVDGTEHLDAVLGDTPLDFFVVLSSSATTVGNIGQANYHCANLYMSSLVAQRRARGLAGSIIHVGYVSDVGYVTRNSNRQLDQHFHNMRLMALSETDVHHAFAEAIRGGLQSAATSHDIIMGLHPASHPIDPETNTPWLANPRFAHFVPSAKLDSAQDNEASSGSLRQKLENSSATSEQEAIDAVLNAFCGKLGAILQLPLESVKESAQRPIIDLGIDSLVAVELRTWFLKELGADVPVVKILGGDTPSQICTTATKKVMAKSIKAQEAGSSTPETRDSPTEPEKAKPKVSTVAATPSVSDSDDRGRSAETTLTSNSSRSPSAGTPTSSAAPSLFSPPIGVSKELGDNSYTSSDADSDSGLSNATSTVTKTMSETNSYSGKPETKTEGLTETKVNMGQGESNPVLTISRGSVTEDHVSSSKPKARPNIVRQERMSPSQARIWFLTKHLDDASSYNMVFHYRATGSISIPRLRRALQTATQHHECLRMCFFSRISDGQPMQGLMTSSVAVLTHIEEAEEGEETLNNIINEFKTRTWDLEMGQTLELTLLSRGQEQYDLVFGFHHIITDIIGFHAFMKDLDTAYRMKPLDRKAAGSHLDYSTEQLDHLKSAELREEGLAFWQSEFSTIPEPLPLLSCASVTARPTKSATANKSHHEYLTLDDDTFLAVKKACQQLRVTPLHFHLATLEVLLARYAGIDDVCVGIVDANRSDPRIRQMVGCFVNMLPVRGHVEAKSSFAEIARMASKKALAAFDHSSTPIDDIIDRVNAPRTPGAAPLFQAALNYRTGGIWDLPLGTDCTMRLSLDDGKDAEVPYDISVGVSDTAKGCAVELHCQSELYSKEACLSMLKAYVTLLKEAATSPQLRVDEYDLYDKTLVNKAVSLGSGPVIDFAWPPTLSERVADMFALYSDSTAVVDGRETVTYADLNRRVDIAAALLLSADCGPGSHVAVLCEPSVDSIVSLLAIWHIGAVYIPLDVSLPTARHATMIENCNPSVVLSHGATSDRLEALLTLVKTPIKSVLLDGSHTVQSSMLATCAAEPHTPAAILYTSGSTGTPKGVVMTQANFLNQIALHRHLLHLDSGVVALQQSSLGFDMSLMQVFSALANGGRLVIAPASTRRDPTEITALQLKHSVSFTIATPSEYLSWINYGSSSLRQNAAWRHANSGGEAIPTSLVTELNRLGLEDLELVNWYGPTEITAAATYQHVPIGDTGKESQIEAFGSSVIGRAIPNYNVAIIDQTGHALPAEHVGEIGVSGAGVVIGYHNLLEETQRKFIKFPGSGQYQRLYRTGDKGKMSADGVIHCFGRMDGDSQIKHRGLRIDCQEVEGAIIKASASLLSAAIVSKRGDVLVAHATISSEHEGTSVDEATLSNILGRLELPQAFIPAAIIIIPTLPVTPNGKLDRKAIAALPLPDDHVTALSSSENGTSPNTAKLTIREGELRLLWERVLPGVSAKSTRLGPDSDFFLCGGNSILLMKLQAAIRESMGASVPTRVLYQASSLREMTNCIDEQKGLEEEADGPAQEINWDEETKVPEALRQQLSKESKVKRVKKEREDDIQVLLTGATTFLGGQILQSLIATAAISKVHCIAIPADDQHLLARHEKIKSYVGSLLEPESLGLSSDERTKLGETVDVIIHAGAHGHCLNTYSSLRVPNLHATQSLASLALSRRIPLLFMSTSRVVLLTGDAAPKPASLAPHQPVTDGSDGYTVSKWASEVFLENLSSQIDKASTPWSVAVHRPCVVVGDQAPNSDALNAILRFSLSMRCVPKLARLGGYIDFGRVEVIAEEIAQAALTLAEGQETYGVQFRHHSGGVKVPAGDLGRHLENLYGGEFDDVDMAEWMVRAAEAGMDPLITAYLEGILHGNGPMVFPYMGES